MQSIQNALNYIEDHLSEAIKIETLAKVAGLSPYYFQRLFKRLVKCSVNDYVRLRKLVKASEALMSKENRILDVALDYGFSDHANFTRAFKEAYGLTPEAYRDCPVTLNHLNKPDLRLNDVAVDENVPIITDGILVEVSRRKLEIMLTFIGIETEVPETELSGRNITGVAATGMIWDTFHRLKPSIAHLLANDYEAGILYMGKAREGCCIYFVGAQATENVRVEGYSSYTLPEGDYVVCYVEAESFAVLIGAAFDKASTCMKYWLKHNGLTCGDFTVEMYETDPKIESYAMEIWLPIYTSDKSIEVWDKISKPSLTTMSSYVNNPLFDALCTHLESEYQCKPLFEYSKCSMQYGWNVKFKKAGRTLCTLYPMAGYFIALIVIGDREVTVTELMLPLFSDYFKQLYQDTNSGMGQKWLMIDVTAEAILADVKQCVAIRRGIKKN